MSVRRVQPQWPGAPRGQPGTPGPARIALVGEAPGQDEEWLGIPFVGASGLELDAMLDAAGIDRSQCLLTNVVMEHPPENNFAAFCLRKEDLPDDYPLHLGPAYTIGGNWYLHPDRLCEGARLRQELATANPNVVVALGATACWALLGHTEIGSARGVVHRSVTSTPYKVIPTWHPAGVMRQYTKRPVAIADLVKARSEAATREIRYDNVEVWLEPTLDDLYAFQRRYIRHGIPVSVDVETRWDEVVCIALAPAPYSHSIVVPFRLDHGSGAPLANYWATPYEERAAWIWLRFIMENVSFPKVGQNFMYDLQRLLRHGIKTLGLADDTMLMHHSLWPELPKDLGFMGSLHTNHPRWKDLAGRHADELKRDA